MEITPEEAIARRHSCQFMLKSFSNGDSFRDLRGDAICSLQSFLPYLACHAAKNIKKNLEQLWICKDWIERIE